MRSLPRPARIAVATLYARLRDARRHRADLLRKHGGDSPAFLVADGKWLEAHNALQAVLAHLHGGAPTFASPRDMLRLTALRGRAFAKAAA